MGFDEILINWLPSMAVLLVREMTPLPRNSRKMLFLMTLPSNAIASM